MKKTIFFLSFLFFQVATSRDLLPIIYDCSAQTYIIHVLRPNDNDYLSDDHRQSYHRSFLPSALLDSGEPRLIYSYSHAVSGFAARLTPEEVEAMEHKEGFVLAVPDQTVKPQTTYTPSFLGLNAGSGPWPDSKFGEGAIVAMIDTGIYPNHVSFADDGTMPLPPKKWRGRCNFGAGVCNNKLIGAMAFRGGTNLSPLDDVGHGTHTSGTAAGASVKNASVLGQAAGTATGIASRAHIAVYKVLFGGSGSLSDVIAGIDRAIADGADVLSMSLGSGPTELYENGIAIASFAAMLHGIFPSAAAGNSGPDLGDLSNDAPWMLTVGAGTTDRRIKVSLLLGDGELLDGESGYQPNVSAVAFTALVYPGGNGDCSPSTLAKTRVAGKVVVCSLSDTIQTGTDVKNAGGAAMVVLGPDVWGLHTSADPNVLPAVYLNHPSAQQVISYITANASASAALIFRGTRFGEPKSPSVAAFSSRGPSRYNGGILKPDVIAPGVNILSAWPYGVGPDPKAGPPNGRFNFLSGTSMATPHLSGVAAIIKKLHPDWSVAAVKSAIVTTAYSAYPNGSPIADQYPDDGPPASFFAEGAGHVDPRGAVDPGLVYDVGVGDYVGYLCGLGYTDAQVRAVVQSNVSCSTVKKIAAEQLNYPSIAVTIAAGARKTVERTVTNVGNAQSVYEVKYSASASVGVVVTPRRLSFSALGEKKSFTVEFRIKDGATPGSGTVEQGELIWVNSGKTVRSPMVFTFS